MKKLSAGEQNRPARTASPDGSPSRAPAPVGCESHLDRGTPTSSRQQGRSVVCNWPRSRGGRSLRKVRGRREGHITFPSFAFCRLSSILPFSVSTSSLVPLSTMTSSSWKAAPHWRGQETGHSVTTRRAATPETLARAQPPLCKPPGNSWSVLPVSQLSQLLSQALLCQVLRVELAWQAREGRLGKGLPAGQPPSSLWRLRIWISGGFPAFSVSGRLPHRSPRRTSTS